MQRVLLLVTVASMLACAIAQSGVAQGRADACVSIKGKTKVDEGDSTCFSDETSHAVATNESSATAINNSKARATNGATNDQSTAVAINNSEATATDGGNARAEENCSATADNGQTVSCP